MYPTVASGGPTPTESNQIMCFVQAGIRVASEPPMVDTVLAVSNVFPAAHTAVPVAFQHLCPCFFSRLFAHEATHPGGYENTCRAVFSLDCEGELAESDA